MEITQLKYFMAAAEFQNVNKAAESINISPGSISKAIAKLETELQTKLFDREGRNIKINDAGRLLQKRGATLLSIEESTRLELAGEKQQLNIHICGDELLLAKYGIDLVNQISDLYPNAEFRISNCSNKEAINKVLLGDAHIAITSERPPKNLKSKLLEKINFKTYLGKGHPLFRLATKGATLDITEVLKHPFVVPSLNIFGTTNTNASLDGWRDDEFRRQIKYKTTSLKLLGRLVRDGKALAYIPEYFIEDDQVTSLEISGCPHFCKQSIYITCRDPKELGWLNQIW